MENSQDNRQVAWDMRQLSSQRVNDILVKCGMASQGMQYEDWVEFLLIFFREMIMLLDPGIDKEKKIIDEAYELRKNMLDALFKLKKRQMDGFGGKSNKDELWFAMDRMETFLRRIGVSRGLIMPDKDKEMRLF